MTDDNKAKEAEEEEKPIHLRLFDYDEDQIKELNHYEILGLQEPVRATPYTIKQAYRKASIRYHPDKTGRGEGDYVFIAVKHAWDTLSDVGKRQAYDSTEMPFDDSIPPDVANAINSSTNGGSSLLLYTDDDFYDTFGPVFERNLRFDTRLQEQTSKKKTGGEIPTLGDPDTPIDKVQAFYDYWTHFMSWRDFSQKAQEELFDNNNPLEDAESRYEKRFYQKEIDKRAKALKRQEMNRIQTLVQRAMAADPRLQSYYREQKEAKEKAALERKLKKEQDERQRREEEEARQKEQAIRDEIEKEQRAQEKAQREKDKKQLRKAKQQLRKITVSTFQEQSEATTTSSSMMMPFKSLEEMSDEVEFLCTEFDLLQIQELTEEFTQSKNFSLIHERVVETRSANEQEKEARRAAATERRKILEQEAAAKAEAVAAAKAWSPQELSALAKAVKKFPGGGANRWEQIATFINNMCRPDEPRTREECIEQYNKIAKNNAPPAAASSAASKASVAATAVETPSSAPAETPPPIRNGVKVAANGHAAHSNGDSSGNPKSMPTSESNMTDVSTTSNSNNNSNADGWSEDQDKQLQDALATYPATMDKNERWTSIAKMVPGKSKKQCVQRFKAIRDAIKSKK